MTGMSLGVRSGSYGSLQHQTQSIKLQTQTSFGARKCSKMLLPCSREKERLLPFYCRYLGRRRVGMLILSVFALLAFVSGFCKVNKACLLFVDAPGSDTSNTARHIQSMRSHDSLASKNPATSVLLRKEDKQSYTSSTFITVNKNGENKGHSPPSFPRPPRASIVMVGAKHDQPVGHQCDNFAFPPPPPPNRRRPGPRPCPVCYIPVEHALASMPSTPTPSPVLRNLMYVYAENPTKTEQHGGSEFGGYPSLMQRNNSFDVKESMAVHCGFVKGIKPGRQTGFDIDEADRVELEQPYDVIVASAIFGNYDVIQQPINISEIATKNVPFFMFIDEETEAYMKNSSSFDGSKRVGLWRIVVVRNIPYTDARRNGKVPKLLLHRLVPNIRYSIWIDGKLQLVVDPYQILERFLWRQNATLAISKHYTRFDVFVEAEANKAAGKYDNASINDQIEFYKKEGLTPYSMAKLPIASDVPEGCVIIREHIPITNLFTCLWFNEVDRFTARDQLSFSTVRDKIMSKVNWTINMFMDCERRNFVVQAYHRDLLEHMAPPVSVAPPALVNDGRGAGRSPAKKNLNKRGKGERRSSSRRHRKVASGTRDSNSTQSY